MAHITVKITDNAVASDHMSGASWRDGRLVGFIESLGRPRVAQCEVLESALVRYSLSGKPSHGEDGTMHACELLVRRLNADGACWDLPNESSLRNLDAVVKSLEPGNQGELKIQVVRGVVESDFWRVYAIAGSIDEVEVSSSVCAAFIRSAIAFKERKIPGDARAEIVLVLNCIETPFLCLGSVTSRFRSDSGRWVDSLGFQEIWLVGPRIDLVCRLDRSEA